MKQSRQGSKTSTMITKLQRALTFATKFQKRRQFFSSQNLSKLASSSITPRTMVSGLGLKSRNPECPRMHSIPGTESQLPEIRCPQPSASYQQLQCPRGHGSNQFGPARTSEYKGEAPFPPEWLDLLWFSLRPCLSGSEKQS